MQGHLRSAVEGGGEVHRSLDYVWRNIATPVIMDQRFVVRKWEQFDRLFIIDISLIGIFLY